MNMRDDAIFTFTLENCCRMTLNSEEEICENAVQAHVCTMHNKWWIRYFGLMVRITSLTIMLIWKSLLGAHLMAGLGRFWTDGNWQEGHRRNLELILLIKCSFGWMRCNYPINGAKLAKTPLWSDQNAKTDFFGLQTFCQEDILSGWHFVMDFW